MPQTLLAARWCRQGRSTCESGRWEVWELIVEPVVCWLLLGWVGGAGGREVPRDWWKAAVDVKDRAQGIHANDHKVPPVPEHHPCNSSPVKPRAHPRAIPNDPNNSPSKPLPRHTPGVVPAMVPTTVPTKFPAPFLKLFSHIPPAPPTPSLGHEIHRKIMGALSGRIRGRA